LKEDNPEKIINYLGRNGINAIVPYRVNEFMDLPIRYKNARKFASSSVSIPIYPKLTNKEVNKIISTVLKFKL
jgi:dTDP-4-amino-4,6-dideoxygalactose transaminase